MERVIFLIEDNRERISCMLNPSEGERDGSGGLVYERISGVASEKITSGAGGSGSDNPLTPFGLGETRLVLNLLFDVTLPGSSIRAVDVRDLTRPLWKLTENATGSGGERRLRRARFIWGKAWNIPIVVESLTERYERFLPDGTPQRSWMKLSLLRVGEETRPAYQPPVRLSAIPSAELLASARSDPTWGTHQKTGDGLRGESLWHMAHHYYGHPGLWRLIARANDLINPLRLKAGSLLRIPPRSILHLGKKR